MYFASLSALVLASLLTGCTSMNARQREADEDKCRSYGFTQRNDAFAECLQRIELDRRAERRADMRTDPFWDRPTVVYRPVLAAPRPPGPRQDQS